MAKQTINVGSQLEDPTADKTRDAFIKVNENFDELYNVNIYTADTDQSITDARSTVIMSGDNLTYTLQNDLAFTAGDGFTIVQAGDNFTLDSSNVTATISNGSLTSTNGSRYLVTKTGRANNIDEYAISQIGI